MTIEEAITHAREVAEGCPAEDRQCAYQHDELADWLEELKAYRETGLMPEEVTALQASNQELKKEALPLMYAKSEDRLVVLPKIKKYATIYWIWGNEIMPARYWGMRGGCVDKDGKYHVICEMRTKRDRTFRRNTRRECTIKAGDRRYFYTDDIGKHIFLTKKDAEAALKEREG